MSSDLIVYFLCLDPDYESDDENSAAETPFIQNHSTGVVTSKPVPVPELWNYVATRKLATDGGLKAEYQVGYAFNFCKIK